LQNTLGEQAVHIANNVQYGVAHDATPEVHLTMGGARAACVLEGYMAFDTNKESMGVGWLTSFFRA
jgi:hypothetical protein